MSDYICNIRCSYRQPSGYCGSTGGWERCQYRQLHQPNTVVGYVPPLKKTNADRIRAMTDEELDGFLNEVQGDAYLVGFHASAESRFTPYGKRWLKWLKQEVSTDG